MVPIHYIEKGHEFNFQCHELYHSESVLDKIKSKQIFSVTIECGTQAIRILQFYDSDT